MIKYRTYKYLIKPTNIQKEIIQKTLECCTIVFNKFINENGFEKYKLKKSKDVFYKYKAEDPNLLLADPSAIMNLLFILQDNRMNRQETKPKNGLIKSYTTSNLNGRQGIYFVNDNKIFLPKVGAVEAVIHRQIPEEANIQKATITIDNVNSYYVCISFSIDANDGCRNININNSIGLDYSSAHLYVDSEGNVCNNKHFYQQQEERITKLKTQLKKCQRGSNNYYKLKNKIGKIYKKVTNQRLDYLHKLSTNLANKYDAIFVEDLDMKEMAQKFSLGKNTYDNSYGTFLQMLNYKMEDRGKVFSKIDRYYPSSKKCNICGYVNEDLSVNEKTWICPKCNAKHNRDYNAAINIRNRGIEEFMSIGYLDNAYKVGSMPH